MDKPKKEPSPKKKLIDYILKLNNFEPCRETYKKVVKGLRDFTKVKDYNGFGLTIGLLNLNKKLRTAISPNEMEEFLERNCVPCEIYEGSIVVFRATNVDLSESDLEETAVYLPKNGYPMITLSDKRKPVMTTIEQFIEENDYLKLFSEFYSLIDPRMPNHLKNGYRMLVI